MSSVATPSVSVDTRQLNGAGRVTDARDAHDLDDIIALRYHLSNALDEPATSDQSSRRSVQLRDIKTGSDTPAYGGMAQRPEGHISRQTDEVAQIPGRLAFHGVFDETNVGADHRR